MKNIFKDYWHEFHAFISAAKTYIWGNQAEKASVKGRLFNRKFRQEEIYIKKVKKLPVQESNIGDYKRINLDNNIYYWPVKANTESLWTVLAEALLPEHPHYYDSFPTTISANDRVLDIGACEGAFSLYAAKKGAKVVAVEPSYIMTKAIKMAAKDENLQNITLVSGLLGPSDNELGFIENASAPEASVITDKEGASETRPCWSLDSFIEKYFPTGIDYIKCDAEGADYDILKSGIKSLKANKPKIAVASYHDQTDFRKIQDLLESIGYSIAGQGIYYSPVLHKCYPMLLKAF